ncbi:MAG: c-type cytochrome [Janthinobacterium lividum]
MRTRLPRIAGALGLLLLAGVTAAAAIAYRPALPPLAASPSPDPAADPALVSRGAALAALGNCVGCHAAPGGAPYAGGRAIPTPFGTLISSNITPDAETGIGTWSEAAFARALREGVDRRGRHLYPALPYDHYSILADDDVQALYAFLRARPAVRAVPPPHALAFPFNFRPLLAGWKLLFLDRAPFRPDPARGAEWNRGAYLVAGLGHCGGCHTPRNALGAEIRGRALEGGEAEGWDAPPLVAALSWSPTPWSDASLFNYLRHGMDGRHSTAGGPMMEVSRRLQAAPEADVRAMAVYLATLQASPGPPGGPPSGPLPEALAARPWPEAMAAGTDEGAVVFAGACAVCHANGTPTAQAGTPSLLLGAALNGPSPRNAIRAVLQGLAPIDPGAGPLMPPYATMLTDAQVAAVLRLLRASVPGRPPWTGLEAAVRGARTE